MTSETQGYSSGKSTLKENSSAKEKYGYGHLGSGTSNQIWGSYSGTTFSKIKQELEAKRRSSWYVYFVLPILFVLTLSSDWAVLYGNIAFSISVLSIKNRCSSFLKKVFLLQKIFYKVFITFKISSGRHLKTWWSLKWRAILKIVSNVFWRIYALSYGFSAKAKIISNLPQKLLKGATVHFQSIQPRIYESPCPNICTL